MFGWFGKKKAPESQKPRSYVSSEIDLSISTGSITAAREKKILSALQALSEMSNSIGGMYGVWNENTFSVVNTYQTRGEEQFGRLVPVECPEDIDIEFDISVELISDQTSSGLATLDILWSGHLFVTRTDPESGDEEELVRDEPDEMTTSQAKSFFSKSIQKLGKLGIYMSSKK